MVVLTQSTKLSSISPVRSTGRRPVMSSRSITPYEKTSDLSVSFPLDAYSGAKYLSFDPQFQILIRQTDSWMSLGKKKKIKNMFYPKVPMIRVDTCVTLSWDSFANPKSATWRFEAVQLWRTERNIKESESIMYMIQIQKHIYLGFKGFVKKNVWSFNVSMNDFWMAWSVHKVKKTKFKTHL